jgi:hypothetical protein
VWTISPAFVVGVWTCLSVENLDSLPSTVMADQTPTVPLEQQLEEIGAQLAWVRDYL